MLLFRPSSIAPMVSMAHEVLVDLFKVELLGAMGVRLGHPYSSEIKGTRLALRELRVQSQGRPLRIFYAFDPRRQAVLLIGGDKTGDDRFYERMVPLAEQIWSGYLAETSK